MIRRKNKRKKCIALILLAVCLTAAGVLGSLMWQELSQRRQGTDYYEDLASQYFPQPDSQLKGGEDAAGEPEWFRDLRSRCKDAVGWICLEDSRMDYPVVQGSDNEFYLHHLADGTENASGSIMMDVQCSPRWEDPVTILYGHHMKDGSMFGGLEKYKSPDYWETHKKLTLYTAAGNFEVEIFAACEVDGNRFSYQPSFDTEEDREMFLEQICAASSFSADTLPRREDRLLILSTCAYSFQDARFIVAGKLSEQQ